MKNEMKNDTISLMKSGMMGLIVGDALGNPVQFMHRDRLKARGPVTGMEAGGPYHTPIGAWTDDSSMALCTLASIRENGEVVPGDIMDNFVLWDRKGEFTPLGYAFDQGCTCLSAIDAYARTGDETSCGRTGEHANGNGALMRILPVCIFYVERCRNICTSDDVAIESIHRVTALTHNHLRAQIGSGLYYFLVKSIIYGEGTLMDRLQSGIDHGCAYYRRDLRNLSQMMHYQRLFDLKEFAALPESAIRSSGYVVDTLEAAVWSLLQADNYHDTLLTAVNLADDADTVGAVCGGLAGLFYGYDRIPEEWLSVIIRREWLENMMD